MKLRLLSLIPALWSLVSVSAAPFTEAQSGQVARLVGILLEQRHFRQAPLDDDMSELFLRQYLDALDYNHLFFLQSDVEEFTRNYGDQLDDATIKQGDAAPAFEIFQRYLQRLRERQQLVEQLLLEDFNFTKDDSIILSRHQAPWPKDEADARELWRTRIKYELLQGRLAKASASEFSVESITNLTALAEKLLSPEPDPVSRFLRDKIASADATYAKTLSVSVVTNADAATQLKLKEVLVDTFNRIVEGGEAIYDEARFRDVSLSDVTRSWLRSNTQGAALVYLNRLLLEDAYPQALAKTTREKPEEAAQTISKRYQRLLKNMQDYGPEEILQVYLTALAHSYDPHSDYMTPSEAEDFDIHNVKLKLSGIGALLRAEDGYVRIVSLVPGGPADLSKQLHPKDRIIEVAQDDGEPVDVVEMPLRKVVDLIRGSEGTTVRLTIIPASAPDGAARKVVTLVRDEIKLQEQYAKARIVEHPDGNGGCRRLGVITLPQFYVGCTAHVEKLIGRLKEERITGLVLDLRRNGGGLLNEAIELTGLFIREGPVVQVKDFRRRTEVLPDMDAKVAYEGPLVVLVNHLSASASEIVAAALQDYGRALVVGDQSTHGKGTVQSLIPLDEFGKLKLTVSKFYRVAGGTTQKNGVTPDIALPSVLDYMELGEAHLPNCLPPGTTLQAAYDHLDLTGPYVEALRKQSAERVNASTDFKYVREDIQLYEEQSEDKSLSLNETRRLREQAEQEARVEARKREREARTASEDKTFEITLQTVDDHGPLVELTGAKLKADEGLAATSIATSEDPQGEADPHFDPYLDEAVNILSDYVSLLSANAGELATGT